MVSLVLLGAGASYGSKDATPYAPPLGSGPKGLFVHMEEQFALVRDLPEALKQKFRDNFEQGMAEYYKYVNGNTIEFQKKLAEYLAQFTPGPMNEYRNLIQSLGIQRFVYSTLNYDLLLELSAAALGWETQYKFDKQPRCIRLRLLKPHGSCNFWPQIPIGTFRENPFINCQTDIVAPVQCLDQQQTLHRCGTKDSIAPAIALYAEGKPVKVCPDYVKEQQRQWNEIALKARRVFVSGVRVHPSDKHIWDTLAKSPANVTYFGLDGDKDEFLTWKESAAKKNAHFIESDFSYAVRMMNLFDLIAETVSSRK